VSVSLSPFGGFGRVYARLGSTLVVPTAFCFATPEEAFAWRYFSGHDSEDVHVWEARAAVLDPVEYVVLGHYGLGRAEMGWAAFGLHSTCGFIRDTFAQRLLRSAVIVSPYPGTLLARDFRLLGGIIE